MEVKNKFYYLNKYCYLNKFYYLILMSILIFTLNFSLTFGAEDINSYQYLKLNIHNDITFNIKPNNLNSVFKVNLNSYFFPQTINNSQYLNSFNSNLKYKLINNSNSFSVDYNILQNNLKSKNEIKNDFIVETTVDRPKLKSKINFPLKNIKKNKEKYLKFYDLIDTNKQIKDQASKLAEGEDDTFVIASKIAKWLHSDIKYDLSTLTLLPNQTSTEVFKSKKGVCKEVSNLYISMMRSIGIPTRVVTGYAYTNSKDIYNLIGSNWGGHAWTEVLIGDKWVPFDLTYNQYGFVDSTHIVLDKYTYIRRNGLETKTISKNGINIDNLNFSNSFKIIEKIPKIYDNGFKINISGVKHIGFDSYGYIKLNVKNKDNFYKVLFLRIAKVKEVKILNKSEKMIIFKPNESKIIYFKFKINSTLNPKNKYIFPFLVYTDFLKVKYNLSVQVNYINLKLRDLPKTSKNNFYKKFSNNNLEFNCKFSISNSLNKLICKIKNPNNFIINNLLVCKNKNLCKTLNLGLNEEKTLNFTTNKFNLSLVYLLKNKTTKLNFKYNKPKIIYNKNLNKNNLKLNFNILNFDNKTKIQIYLNYKLLKEIRLKEFNINFKLLKKNNNLEFRLIENGRLINKIKFNQSVKGKYLPNLLSRNIQILSNNFNNKDLTNNNNNNNKNNNNNNNNNNLNSNNKFTNFFNPFFKFIFNLFK